MRIKNERAGIKEERMFLIGFTNPPTGVLSVRRASVQACRA
jgi:hypothetical protein